MNIVAFEAINNVWVDLRMVVGDHRGGADIQITATAMPRGVAIGDQPPLGSVNVSCSGTRLKSLEAALIHTMYLLDGQLAAHEMGVKK